MGILRFLSGVVGAIWGAVKVVVGWVKAIWPKSEPRNVVVKSYEFKNCTINNYHIEVKGD